MFVQGTTLIQVIHLSCFKSVKLGRVFVYWKENVQQRVDNVCSVKPKQRTIIRTAT